MEGRRRKPSRRTPPATRPIHYELAPVDGGSLSKIAHKAHATGRPFHLGESPSRGSYRPGAHRLWGSGASPSLMRRQFKSRSGGRREFVRGGWPPTSFFRRASLLGYQSRSPRRFGGPSPRRRYWIFDHERCPSRAVSRWSRYVRGTPSMEISNRAPGAFPRLIWQLSSSVAPECGWGSEQPPSITRMAKRNRRLMNRPVVICPNPLQPRASQPARPGSSS